MPKYHYGRHRPSLGKQESLGLPVQRGVSHSRLVIPGSKGFRLDVSFYKDQVQVRDLSVPDGFIKNNSSEIALFLIRLVKSHGDLTMPAAISDRLGVIQIAQRNSDFYLDPIDSDSIALRYIPPQDSSSPNGLPAFDMV